MSSLSYEVTPLTMAILSKPNMDGSVHTVVLEEMQEYSVSTAPTKMIDQACKFYGKSLSGLQEGTKSVSNITHKVPIAIDSASGMYFFPTASPTNKSCSWLSHTHIKDIRQIDNGSRTEIIFKNKRRIIIDVSFGSMQNQLHRTAQFRFSLDNRMEIIRKTIEDRINEW